MKFTLEIDMSNAAFGDDRHAAGEELRRILEALAAEDGSNACTIEGNILSDAQVPVRDLNGNYVGFWQVAGDDAKDPKIAGEV